MSPPSLTNMEKREACCRSTAITSASLLSKADSDSAIDSVTFSSLSVSRLAWYGEVGGFAGELRGDSAAFAFVGVWTVRRGDLTAFFGDDDELEFAVIAAGACRAFGVLGKEAGFASVAAAPYGEGGCSETHRSGASTRRGRGAFSCTKSVRMSDMKTQRATFGDSCKR